MSIVCFVCLIFAWGFSSYLRNFHSYWDVTSAGEGLQILTCARHSWAIEQSGLFSVPHLLWHGSSFYTGHLPKTRDTRSHYCRGFNLAMELSLPVFTTEACRALDSNTNLPLAKRICRLLNNELIIVENFCTAGNGF